MAISRIFLIASLCACTLTACGQKGPLYMPGSAQNSQAPARASHHPSPRQPNDASP